MWVFFLSLFFVSFCFCNSTQNHVFNGYHMLKYMVGSISMKYSIAFLTYNKEVQVTCSEDSAWGSARKSFPDHWAYDRNSCRMSIPQFVGERCSSRLLIGSQMALENLDDPQWNWWNLHSHQTSHLEEVPFHCQKLNRANK